MSAWVVLGVLLTIAAVAIVALPFLSASDDRLAEPDAEERRRLELAEERDRALAALKELEFDHRTGKVSDDDYRALVGPLRQRAVETLRALDGRTVYGGRSKHAANRRNAVNPRAVIDPSEVPEPMPVPSEPPGPVIVPEPSPVPSEPPAPVPAPDPMPEPSPPQPEPPQGR